MLNRILAVTLLMALAFAASCVAERLPRTPVADDIVREVMHHTSVSRPDFSARRRVSQSPYDQKRAGLPLIRIGTTHIDYGPLVGWGTTDKNVWQMYMAMGRTYTVGGTQYAVQLISYLDDGSDVNTTIALVNTLAYVDKVHLMFGGYGGTNVPAFLPAASATGIPCINHGSFDISFLPTSYANWTVNVLPSIASIGYECGLPLYAAGARNFTAIADNSLWTTPGSAFIVTGIIVPALQNAGLKFSAPYFNITADVWTKPELLDPIIQQLKGLNPDVAVFDFGQANNIIFIDRMRQNNWNPNAYFVYGTGSYPEVRFNLTWKDAGSLISESYQPELDSTDPLWGSTRRFNDMEQQLFNTTSANSDANLAAGLTVLDGALQVTPNLLPGSIFQALLSYSGPTIVGNISFVNGVVDRKLYCFQNSFPNATSILVVGPNTSVAYTPLVYPAVITYPKGYFESLRPPVDNTLRNALVIVFSILGGLLIIAIVVVIVVTQRSHIVFIPKSSQNSEWGSQK